MSYLLDTNACFAIVNGTPPGVRCRLRGAISAEEQIIVSSVAACELWCRVSESVQREENTERLETFLAGPLRQLEFDQADARTAGRIRADLERRGEPIGAYDVLIAGQAMQRGLTLVTANASEFGRVTELTWEDWAGEEQSCRQW